MESCEFKFLKDKAWDQPHQMVLVKEKLELYMRGETKRGRATLGTEPTSQKKILRIGKRQRNMQNQRKSRDKSLPIN